MRIGIIILFLAACLFSQSVDYFTKCAYHNGIYVAIGMNKSGTYLNYYFIKTSKDSVVWQRVSTSLSVMCDVQWLEDRFVVVGYYSGSPNYAVTFSLNAVDWRDAAIALTYVCGNYSTPMALREVRVVTTPTANKFVARGYTFLNGYYCNVTAGNYYFYYYSTDSCKSWLQYDGADWGSAVSAVERHTATKAASAKAPIYYDILGRKVPGVRPGIYFSTDGIKAKKVFRPY